MLNVREALVRDIAEGLRLAAAAGDLVLPEGAQLDFDARPVVVTWSDKAEHGDYASPVALSLGKQFGMKPMDLLPVLAEHMPKKEYIGRITAVEPGFLNIWLHTGWLMARLDNIIEQNVCGEGGIGEGKSVNLEFISANPTGPLTFGNARTAFTVDTLANVLSCAGYAVTREYYVNDAGGQIRTLGESIMRRILLEAGVDVEYTETLYQGDYIREVAGVIAERWRENDGKEFGEEDLVDAELVFKVGAEAAGLLLDDIKKTIVDDLKIEMDVWTSEQQLRDGKGIEQALEKLRGLGLTYKKDDAEYLKTTEFGDSEDRVLVKSDGEYAYIAPDIAYHQDKYDREFDELYTFVGADHQGHAPKLMAAMQALGNDTSKLHVVAAQWLRFIRDGKPVKLSKRAGELFSPQDLIAEVGYDATRFFMVQHALTTHMDFDLDLAKERSERNPVYYVQYGYVRLQSILRQAKERGVITEVGMTFDLTDSPELTHTQELNLMRKLYRFPEIIEDVVDRFEVHSLAYYAMDLAKAIHVFYKHVPVLGGDDEVLTKSRLQLVLAARTVMGETLDLLGISKPDIM